MKDIPALLEQNLRTLEKSQPKLAARLWQYMDELPALREPVFRETPSGRWVEGLTEKPFREEESLLEKRSKAAPSAVYLVFGTGCTPYLFHVLRSLPESPLGVSPRAFTGPAVADPLPDVGVPGPAPGPG